MTTPHDDTIVAIATGAGPGGIGVVRLSGRDARTIARTICGRALPARRALRAHFRDAAGEIVDDGLALVFPGPRSYTGQDVVELHAHGARVVLDALVEAAVARGARRARPGEFTERAFLNGKLDLVQAEAVADLVAASSAQQARAARRSLAGAFSREVEALVAALVALRVRVEASIDFADEPVPSLEPAALAASLAALRTELSRVCDTARRGARLRDGLHVVIVGRPNAGKSSLLNALAGEERAIVTAVPGTTRDVLRETIQFDGIELTLVDTAGLRETEDAIEAEGVRRARAEVSRADLALVVLDASLDSAERAADRAALEAELAPGTRIVRLASKADLADDSVRAEPAGPADTLRVSARTGEGLASLRALLRDAAGANEAGGTYSARARHVDALERADAALAEAARELGESAAAELVAESLRHAQHALGEITGTYTTEDLLGAVFSTFCIGK